MEKNPKPIDDTLESKKVPSEKHPNLKKRLQVIGLAATILATSTFGVGCGEKAALASEQPSVSEEADKKDAGNQVSDDEFFDRAKIYPKGTETPEGWLIDDTINYYFGTQNIAEGHCFEQLTPDQQSEIKELEALSVEEFNALPQTEQLKYAFWLFENYKPEHDMYLKLCRDKRHYTMEPKTAEDLADNIGYFKSMMECFCTVDYDAATDTKTFTYDMENASKLIAMQYYNNGTILQKVQDGLPNLGQIYIVPGSITATGYSEKDDGTIYVSVNEEVLGETYKGLYGFYPMDFTDIHGVDRTVYLAREGYVEGRNVLPDIDLRSDVQTEIIKY